MTPDLRIQGIDGLRGLAILLVMLFHFTVDSATSLIDVPLVTIARYGMSGVDLFFVISGFLITGILIDAKGKDHYFRNFYIRRALRILPLYYGFVVGLILLYPRVGGPTAAAEAHVLIQHQWWYWTYTVNWLVALTGDFTTNTTLATGGFWSLAIEEQFYLVWPLVVFFSSRRLLLRICLAMVATSFALRLCLTFAGASWTAVYSATFTRLDPLAIGGALALFARSPAGFGPLRRYAPRVALLSALGFIALEVVQRKAEHPNPTLGLAFYCTLATFLYASLLVLTVTAGAGSLWSGLGQSGLLRTLGKYSYALYLFHGHMNRLFQKLHLDRRLRVPVGGAMLPGQVLYIVLAIGS
ncbi:MAG TPA: acyltransferase, partial [Pyrinomonadaceae bacterium]|nr:acyltransferase [Pyrinomonadaceae bacterium]